MTVEVGTIFKKFFIVAFLFSFLVIFLNQYQLIQTKKYKDYLSSLSAEDIIREHFKNKNDNNVSKMKETLTDRHKSFDSSQPNLEYIKIIDLNINETETKKAYDDYHDNYVSVLVYDVTYEVKYRKVKEQDEGIYTWRYTLVKEHEEAPWLIDEFGF